jgi:exopolysaccharide biosynthesis polyprenyl glycosylphosphotransferase
MNVGWQYRIAGVVGTAVLTAFVVTLVNNATVLELATEVPVIGRLPAEAPHGTELLFEMLTATVVVVAAFVPLYKPRPRRILDAISLAQKRVLLAMVGLAAIGYFDYTYRLPRLTVLLATPMLLVVLPGWFVYIRRRPHEASRRAVVVGDDPEQIERVVREVDVPLFGYLCPTRVRAVEGSERAATTVADGGRALGRLGGLSRIEDVLVDYDIDTAFLAFESTDRAEFFGTLDTCYEHGVSVKVHREHADRVLTSDVPRETFVDVEVEPWDVQDYVIKRVFDVAFSLTGLVILSPVMAAIVAAIKLHDGGSILYRQERTAVFGETFDVYKFRSMVEDAEDRTGPLISEEDNGGEDPRVTRVGRILRQTHLDEIPQLWSVLRGDMSVVGPRPERPELEEHMELGTTEWRSRWFVKPGLTGLAQISGATGHEPEKKLRHDLEYIRRQSFGYDLKIVVRQVWKVGQDALDVFFGLGDRND